MGRVNARERLTQLLLVFYNESTDTHGIIKDGQRQGDSVFNIRKGEELIVQSGAVVLCGLVRGGRNGPRWGLWRNLPC